MKYKSRTNSSIHSEATKNKITTFHLKIKNINILLDDLTTDKTTQNTIKTKRPNSLKNNNDLLQKFSTYTTNNSTNYIYNKKKFNSKKVKNDKNRTLKSIHISFKKLESYNNTESSIPSLLTTMEGFYTTNLTGLISERNNINKKIIENKNNYNDICCNINEIIKKKQIYIKKSNKTNSKYNYKRSSLNNNEIKRYSLTKPIIKNKEINKFVYKSKTINLKPLKENNKIIEINKDRKIENKKIKFNKKNKTFRQNSIDISFTYNIKYIIIIQNWWKNIKYKKNVIIKSINNKNQSNVIKIPKFKNIHEICYINKIYYKNNILSIILIQKNFKKYLTKINFYSLFTYSNNSTYFFYDIKKPELKPCYISKGNYKKGLLNSKSINLINSKINNTISKKNRKMKYKLLINNYSSYSYNFKVNEDYNLKTDENINFQSFNNSESHDFNNNDIINKIKNDYLDKTHINNNKSKILLYELFIKDIYYQIYLLLSESGNNYKNILNFTNSIYYIFIKSKSHKFFKNLYFDNKRKINFFKSIGRHINIYKKNNYIKNEIIELIETNLGKEVDYVFFDSKHMKFNDIQENNLINTQILQEDNNLINYIYLFFKYEKDKIINITFIKNRLIKEPLNYRNIFTILRYIDNLNEKINSNKICTKCFCKKNEKVCSLKCNCHFPKNLINIKKNIYNDFYKNKEIGEENIENNPNLLNINSDNKFLFNTFNEYNNNNDDNDFNLDLTNNVVKGMRINKTFHYFN